jgi:hypothetical protein
MLITKDYLQSLNPCKNRFDHYLTCYSNWQGTLEEFLDLSELTQDDKKWVFVRSIPKEKLSLLAADFAERVLHIYESKYPNDDRPRKAIEAARSGDKNAADAATAATAAYAAYAAAAAAYDADAAYADARADAAYADARAAAAAAAAADAAADAATAATAAYAAAAAAYDADAAYADARAAADAAANAANAANAAVRKDEEQAQIEIMKKYAREALRGDITPDKGKE